MIIPQNWNKKAHEFWLKNDRNNALQFLLKDLNQYPDKKPKGLILQFTYYLFHIKDFNTAMLMLKSCLEYYSEDIEIIKNLAVISSYAGQHKDAIFYAKKSIQLDPNTITPHDTLATSYHHLKKYDEASAAGTASLTLKDKHYGRLQPLKLPQEKPSLFAADKKRVISYSLWGNSPRYLRGALRNLLLAPDLYPGWELWFWLDDTVPTEFQELIIKLGGHIKKQSAEKSLFHKLSWRFYISDCPDVGYFLVRDADSVLSIREVRAVDEWLNSDNYFHVMRDWWSHTDLILAGMWGGIANILPNIEKLIQEYRPEHVATKNADQWFLRDKIWCYIKSSVFVHDRCFAHMTPHRWPSQPYNNEHVGYNESAHPDANQEILLEAWIKNYSCLQVEEKN